MHTVQTCDPLLPMFGSLCVCRSVSHNSEPCENGWTDWDAVWVVDLGGPMEPCIRWWPGSAQERGILGVVPSSKCIRLCKQQTPQQHGAASLVGREQRITTKARLQNGRLSCCGGDKCSGGDATFRRNSLTTCYWMHMTSYLLLQFTLAILIISV